MSLKQTLGLKNEVPEKPAEMTQIPPANDNAEALKYVGILNKCGLKINRATFEAKISTHDNWKAWKKKLLDIPAAEQDAELLVKIFEATQQGTHREYDPSGAYEECKDFATRYTQFVTCADFTKMADKNPEWKTAFENFELQKFSSTIKTMMEDFLVEKSFKHAMKVCKQNVEDIDFQQFYVVVLNDGSIQDKLFAMRGYSEFLMSLEGLSFLRKCRKVEVAKSN